MRYKCTSLRYLKQGLFFLFIILTVKLLRNFDNQKVTFYYPKKFNVNIQTKSIKKTSASFSENVNEDNESCKLKFSTKLSNKPLIYLDPNKFLMPSLVNGPNNQLRGFMDSIYMAIRLNRTLILPNFYKHRTEKEANEHVPADIRIDVEHLSRFISIVRDHHSVCKTFDVLLLSNRATHLYNSFSLIGIERRNNVSILQIKNQEGTNRLQVLPINKKDVNSGDKEVVQQAYRSERKCALYMFPFNSAHCKSKKTALKAAADLLKSNAMINLESLQNNELYALGELSCNKPTFIREIQSQFYEKIAPNGGSVVAAQWRYDAADWMRRCSKQLLPGGKKVILNMCEKINNITAQDIAESLFVYVQNVTEFSKSPVHAVYLSAPLTIQDFISEVKVAFKTLCEKQNIHNLKIYTHQDLKKKLSQFFACNVIKKNWEDVLSTVEMAICSEAIAFLYSPTSSWSQFVRREREILGHVEYDHSVLDFVWMTHIAKQNK